MQMLQTETQNSMKHSLCIQYWSKWSRENQWWKDAALFDASFPSDTFLARDRGLITYLLQCLQSEMRLCSSSYICLLTCILSAAFPLTQNWKQLAMFKMLVFFFFFFFWTTSGPLFCQSQVQITVVSAGSLKTIRESPVACIKTGKMAPSGHVLKTPSSITHSTWHWATQQVSNTNARLCDRHPCEMISQLRVGIPCCNFLNTSWNKEVVFFFLCQTPPTAAASP